MQMLFAFACPVCMEREGVGTEGMQMGVGTWKRKSPPFPTESTPRAHLMHGRGCVTRSPHEVCMLQPSSCNPGAHNGRAGRARGWGGAERGPRDPDGAGRTRGRVSDGCPTGCDSGEGGRERGVRGMTHTRERRGPSRIRAAQAAKKRRRVRVRRGAKEGGAGVHG
jgi:hypothetical protein